MVARSAAARKPGERRGRSAARAARDDAWASLLRTPLAAHRRFWKLGSGQAGTKDLLIRFVCSFGGEMTRSRLSHVLPP